ncbi:MAG: YraN family protein [Rhodospirillaceae bacterium]|jgi:putative endonuclease|nr:YraN family protein [Rhodospirillaceae bacterium]MBT5458091.1 YraN family protein [Rhodospirillaceae bacterium]
MVTPSERQRRERAGRRAEDICAWYLRLKGYRVLARRFRTAVGEIDIIARRGPVVAMIEVKARSTNAEAIGSVSARQRQRIARASLAFLQKNSELADKDLRFDVMLVTPWHRPHHVIDAWRES